MDLDNFDLQVKKIFPPNLALFDYMGYLYKGMGQINKIAIGLGLNLEMLKKAIEVGAQVLIVHNGPEDLKINKYYTKILEQAKKANLSIYRAHLPLDFGPKGLIENLCALLKFRGTPTILKYEGYTIYGGVYLSKGKVNYEEIVTRLKKLNPSSIRVAGKIKKDFKIVAITTGDGCKSEFLIQLRPDAFICGLLNQESERVARDLGITIFEATSYATENEPLKMVFKNLKYAFDDLEIEFIDLDDSVRVIYDKLEKKL